MKMHGIERDYCNEATIAVIAANRAVLESPAKLALERTENYGKGDTIGLDATPEIVISERLKSYDPNAIIITEEISEDDRARWPIISDPVLQPLMLFSDPTDRSKFLRLFIEKISKGHPTVKVGELMATRNCIRIWQTMFETPESPATITGATISITCLRKGVIIFSVILNYITQTIFIACPSGVYYMKLPKYNDKSVRLINLDYVLKHGQILNFPAASETCIEPDDYKRFVTFLGKEGYEENFNNSMIFVENPRDFLHHTEPGGPARILYLSDLQRGHGPIGFIMANGEKIGEWIHWLAFVKFAQKPSGGPALRVFEVAVKRPMTKAGILMSTTRPYSIFSNAGDSTFLNISPLRNFAQPNLFRSMLVVTPNDNETITGIMRQRGYREIRPANI